MRRPVLVTREIVQEIYPVDPDPAVPSTAQVSVAFTAEVMDFIPITLKRMPRLSEPGPLSMRAEHWHDLGPRPETVIYLPGSSPTSPRPPSQMRCYKTYVQAKSHHSLNLQEDTDHSL